MGRGFIANELAKKNEINVDHIPRLMELTLDGDAAGVGGLLTKQNTSNYDRLITRLIIRRTTAAGSTLTADAGCATSTASSVDNLLDGVNLNTTGIVDSTVGGGTNGLGSNIWAQDAYLLISANTDPSTMSFAGTAYVEYIRLMGADKQF